MSDKENEEKHFAPLSDSNLSDREERTARALATLRLLNDKDNPYSLKQMIAHARELAETYELWSKSEALIKDIAVRLSGGKEITSGQSDVGPLCGLHFVRSLPRDEVLQIWKKADEQFEEVQLLSLPLSSVPPNEVFSYKKKYPNGQTLSLTVENVDGQYSVHVDCTEPKAEPVPKPAPKKPIALPAHKRWLALIAFVFAWLASFLRLPEWLLRPRREYGYALVLIVLTSVGLNCLLLKNLAQSRTSTSDAPPSVTTFVPLRMYPVTTEMQKGNQPNPLSFSSDGNRFSSAMRITVRYTARTDDRIDRAHVQMSPILTIHAPDQIISINDLDLSASLIFAPACDVTSIAPPTQGQTKVGEETVLRDALRQALNTKLENTDLFIVFADNKRFDLQKGLWVGVRYTPMQKSSGTVIAELFDSEGKLFWRRDGSTPTFQTKRFENGAQLLTGAVATQSSGSVAIATNLESQLP
jgi:hypothetical protein